jgi:hypothetical protein
MCLQIVAVLVVERRNSCMTSMPMQRKKKWRNKERKAFAVLQLRGQNVGRYSASDFRFLFLSAYRTH